MNTPSVLTGSNFEAMLAWMSTEGSEAPPFAEEFMVTLDLLYMSRSGRSLRRSRMADAPSSRLSLTFLKDNPIQEKTAPSPTRKEALDAIATKEAPRPAAPPRRLGDGEIPFTDENGFREAGLDSLDVAKAVAWHYTDIGASAIRGCPLSLSFLQKILYVVYGTFLAERGTRLTAEHPQMWKFGPVFPRVQNKFEKGITADRETAMTLKEKDPTLDEFIPRIIRILSEKRSKDIKHIHTAPSSPWGKCLQEHPDKWGTFIDDREIAAWFRKDIDKTAPKTK